MIARMSISERAEIMSELRVKLFDLHEELWEVLSDKFAPYDRRNYESGYNAEDAIKHAKPYDDIDAPLITEIFYALASKYDDLEKRCRELNEEEARRDEAYEMFYAWELGLCPYVMREHRREGTPYVRNSLNWEDIAKFLNSTGMSREDTAHAIREYLKDKDLNSDRVIAVARETWRAKKA